MDQGRPTASSCGALSIPRLSRHITEGWTEDPCPYVTDCEKAIASAGQFDKYCSRNHGEGCDEKFERQLRELSE